MRKEIPSLEFFGKAKTDKFSVILFGRMRVSVVTDLLRAKKNQLEITKRGGLRLKLTALQPRIKQICNQHQAQSSH